MLLIVFMSLHCFYSCCIFFFIYFFGEKIDQFFKFQINTIAVFGTILILLNFYLLVR